MSDALTKKGLSSATAECLAEALLEDNGGNGATSGAGQIEAPAFAAYVAGEPGGLKIENRLLTIEASGVCK